MNIKIDAKAYRSQVLPYLVDWLICTPSCAQVVQDTAHLLSHMVQLDPRVNLEMSCLNPSQTTTFMGVV